MVIFTSLLPIFNRMSAACELWFGIITKQLLNRRSSFKSVEELNAKIMDYIDYYNENLAKKFKWNYSGKILKA
jgi:hypothetical protein